MGDLRPENGGGPPPDDGGSQPNGLPPIPPEWGPVVIPDDPADLADEAASVRRELRRERRHNRVRRVFGLSPVKLSRGEAAQSLAVPLFIMFTAVVITLVSLFVVTWDQDDPNAVPPPGSAPRPTPAGGLAGVTLLADGREMALGSRLPAVVLLVDNCSCEALVTQVAAATEDGVNVLAVGREAPTIEGGDPRVYALGDPAGLLRARVVSTVTPQEGTATAMLVDRRGEVVAVIPGVRDVGAIRPVLPKLQPSP